MMLEPFDTLADMSKQILIILEDYMPLIQNSDQNILKIFLKNSRHKNIRSSCSFDKLHFLLNLYFSILAIAHDLHFSYGGSASGKNSFERALCDESSIFHLTIR